MEQLQVTHLTLFCLISTALVLILFIWQWQLHRKTLAILQQQLEQPLAQQLGESLVPQLTTSIQQSFQQMLHGQQSQIQKLLFQMQQQQIKVSSENHLALMQALHEHKEKFSQNQTSGFKQLIEHLQQSTQAHRQEMQESLQQSSKALASSMKELTDSTDNRLKDISKEVENRLSEGFEKTTKTFNDILKRLALIDDAQKKITELSSNVVSLQEVLADKRSRGAFGEVQLNALIRNVLPEKHFSIQHTLSNGKIADCMLFLPKPTGNVVIDSKFPLESYQRMQDLQLTNAERKAAQTQFRQDIKKHIKDISEKYLISNETADGAVMFIPAEAIFAEIHGHYPELVEIAHRARVWLASPTTLMAILTTARSVLKDEATRQQVHIIQEHLAMLGEDFNRFTSRFDNLARHIDQAASDVKQIHTSAHKISRRFAKIDQVEMTKEPTQENDALLDVSNDSDKLLNNIN
ncbi:DNA recombination protein RmuC [Thalassotalea litorea]|uniref:DNA recombination protein RmuC n=1 Tax=Thalassotalea litorea TaxID=2020715 RepID=A0A5R9II71_9GAMM|nr:DNA recombination protein RmuC [Thalassotalea litorea]TLU61858.1 DNA recombination protein RmuC [Thalassotalea litorea]